jgi:hypothetical protein
MSQPIDPDDHPLLPEDDDSDLRYDDRRRLRRRRRAERLAPSPRTLIAGRADRTATFL